MTTLKQKNSLREKSIFALWGLFTVNPLKKDNHLEETVLSADLRNHCGRFSHKQTDFLWIHSFHKHNEHFMKEHCFSQGSEERKTHGVTWHTASYTTKHGWDGCSAITSSPKPFHFLNALHSVHTWQHTTTPRNWSSWQEHIGLDTHMTVTDHMRDGWMGWHWQVLMTTPWHSLPPHPTIKLPPFHPSSLSNSNHLPSAHSTTLPNPSPFAHCVHVTLPQPHIISLWVKKREKTKRNRSRLGLNQRPSG